MMLLMITMVLMMMKLFANQSSTSPEDIWEEAAGVAREYCRYLHGRAHPVLVKMYSL